MFDLMDAIANLQTVFAVAATEAGREARRRLKFRRANELPG
jgi:hypothetical protein